MYTRDYIPSVQYLYFKQRKQGLCDLHTLLGKKLGLERSPDGSVLSFLK